MADVRRPHVVAGLPFLGALVGGGGCGPAISNELFLEESEFLAALPGAERLAPPSSIFLAPNGDSLLLRAAKEAATDWDRLVAVLAVSGDGLRAEAEGAERSEVVRRWADVNVAHRFGPFDPLGFAAVSADWFVSAEILRLGETTFEWTLSVASGAQDEEVIVASGVHEASGGTFTWDAESAAVALGVVPGAEVGALDIDYALPIGDGTVTEVDATQRLAAGTGRSFTIAGDEILAFDGAIFAITSDGAEWPGAAVVVHGAIGGRAEGVVVQDGETKPFGSCWDEAGQTTWLGGDPAIAADGAEAACAVDPIVIE
jgi:hypothetical protein